MLGAHYIKRILFGIRKLVTRLPTAEILARHEKKLPWFASACRAI